MGMNSRVVITGIGVISSIGIGKDLFWDRLNKGIVGTRPITLFDTGSFACKQGAEIENFDPEEFLGKKGLRHMDRSTQLVLSATKMALENRSNPIDEENLADVGVVIGTAFGSIQSIGQFDRESLENPNYVNPMAFPNTVINSPASQISIKYDTKRFNVTISNGFSASLDAIGYALSCIRTGMTKTVLAGGVEELSIESYAGFYYNKLLSGSNGDQIEIMYPYDKKRKGIILGEGTAVLLVEDLESAKESNANILAEVVGYGTCCDASYEYNFNPNAYGAKNAMSMALEDAKMDYTDIDYICGSGNGNVEGDGMELKAIGDVFKNNFDNMELGSIKASIGECFGASGAIQTVVAVWAIENGLVPPTANFTGSEKEYDVINICSKAKSKNINNVMINSFGCNGINSSLVIKKYIP